MIHCQSRSGHVDSRSSPGIQWGNDRLGIKLYTSSSTGRGWVEIKHLVEAKGGNLRLAKQNFIRLTYVVGLLFIGLSMRGQLIASYLGP